MLVTPALLRRLPNEGIADKALSALLAGERLIPIVHNTTFDALREVSPLLASRSGLSTVEEPMADVAAKLAELVALPAPLPKLLQTASTTRLPRQHFSTFIDEICPKMCAWDVLRHASRWDDSTRRDWS